MKKYVLLGGAGYVAEKHYRAIKETGGELIAILDPHDNVGILDSYFPNCKYFSEFERFDSYCSGQDIDYTVVCSQNHQHESHARFGLRIGSDVICEKPLALNERNLVDLKYVEDNTDHRVWNILQLRLSDVAVQLKKNYNLQEIAGAVSLKYYTPRGDWYTYSWKSDIQKSGGIATNIGIHLFDLLLWLFGDDWAILKWTAGPRKAIGQFKIGNFKIDVVLSIEKNHQPERTLTINGEEFDLSKGFTDLHTLSYKKILNGEGFGIEDVRPGIKLCEKLRGVR